MAITVLLFTSCAAGAGCPMKITNEIQLNKDIRISKTVAMELDYSQCN